MTGKRGRRHDPLRSRITLVPDDENPFLALDESGRRLDYARGGSVRSRGEVDALAWLGVRMPDYLD